MTANKTIINRRRFHAALLVGTHAGGIAAPASAQTAAQPAAQQPPVTQPAEAVPVPARPMQTIRTLRVTGAQRLEPETVISYSGLRPGISYDQETLDEALRQMLATELFADVQIAGVASGDIELQVRDETVINRIVLEGNRRIKRRQDNAGDQARRRARSLRARALARDVARIIELYRRQGHASEHGRAADHPARPNRVDVVFEINEGPRSPRPPDQRHRQRAILGRPPARRDGDARGPFLRIFSSSDTSIPTASPTTSRR